MVHLLSLFSGAAAVLPTLILASPAPAPAQLAARGNLKSGGNPNKCNEYLIIQTRGTYERQGPSLAFNSTINKVYAAVKGGANYNTVYPANENQQFANGTKDIVHKIETARKKCPKQVYVLMGYSQGASATVAALPKIKGKYETAVKAVVLFGNPYRKPGLKSNIDGKGTHTMDNASGIVYNSASQHIPKSWDNSGKVLDVCENGDKVNPDNDGVCDSKFSGINSAHLAYDRTPATVTLTSKFIIKQLKAAKA